MIRHEITYHDNYEIKCFKEYSNELLVEETHYDKLGNKHGTYREWHPNGKLWVEQNHKHGIRHGINKLWFDNGQINQRVKFQDGYICELTNWDIRGALLTHKTYTKGLIR